jgi:hypothetical protein
MLEACADLKLDATPGEDFLLLLSRRKLERDMMAPIPVLFRFVDVRPLSPVMMRKTFIDLGKQRFNASDVIENGTAASDILHSIQVDAGIAEFPSDTCHAFWPSRHVAFDANLAHAVSGRQINGAHREEMAIAP